MAQSIRLKRRRRRSSSLEAEIRVKAKAIIAEREAEAYKAAALMICSRKLDEIRNILQSVGVSASPQGFMGAGSGNGAAMATQRTPSVQPVDPEMPGPGEPACCQCGRKGIKQSRKSKFNPTGSWYCRFHVTLAQRSDAEDVRDAAVLGVDAVAGPSIAKKPVLIQTHAPAKMVPPPEPPQETPGSGSLAEAMGMAALGVE